MMFSYAQPALAGWRIAQIMGCAFIYLCKNISQMINQENQQRANATIEAIRNDAQILAVDEAIADLIKKSVERRALNENGELVNLGYDEPTQRRIDAYCEVKEARIASIISYFKHIP